MFTAPYEFRNKNWNYLYLKKINLVTYSRLWLIKIGRYIHEIKISCFHFEMCMQVEKKLIYCKVLLLTIILSPYRLSRMFFFSQLFNWFQLFSSDFFSFWKLQDTVRTGQKYFLKGCIRRWFQLFSLIFSYFIFYP